MPENLYKVPKDRWSTWSPQARRIFNTVYDTMVLNQKLFLHPKAARPKTKHWKTTAWNAAWFAADGVMYS